MSKKYVGRKIQDELLNLFIIDDNDPSKNGKLSLLTAIARQDPYLDFEMRGDRVILYYRGGMLLTIFGEKSFVTLADEYYISEEDERLTFNIENALEYISKAKYIIDKHEVSLIERKDNKKRTVAKLGEKEIQQRIVYENNLSVNAAETEYFVADVEWADNSGLGGRADIVAFRWERMKHSKRSLKLVLIEVKQGDGSISGNNGLVKHYNDFLKFKSDEKHVKCVGEDMLAVLEQKKKLGLVKGLEKLFTDGSNDIHPTIEEGVDFVFLLSNYHHFSTKLKAEAEGLPDEARFALSSFMGYGLYEAFIMGKKQLKELFSLVF